MSDKLVRDELLRSHRFQRLSGDTPKLLFLVLLLSSDSLSNAEYNTTALSVAMGRPITDDAAAALLAELADRDLIRPYESDSKTYVHIPRSRQRIRYLSGKHPRPPLQMEDKEISRLIEKVGLKSDRGQTQVGRSEELLLLPLKSRTTKTRASADANAQLFAQFWVAYPKKKNKGQAEKAWDRLKPDTALLASMLSAIKRAKAGEGWLADAGKFIPYPATWLNAKGWEDEDQPQQTSDWNVV